MTASHVTPAAAPQGAESTRFRAAASRPLPASTPHTRTSGGAGPRAGHLDSREPVEAPNQAAPYPGVTWSYSPTSLLYK